MASICLCSIKRKVQSRRSERQQPVWSLLTDHRNHGQRCLMLMDNVSVAIAGENKRAHSLLQLCRRLGALELATHTMTRSRWMPSVRSTVRSTVVSLSTHSFEADVVPRTR